MLRNTDMCSTHHNDVKTYILRNTDMYSTRHYDAKTHSVPGGLVVSTPVSAGEWVWASWPEGRRFEPRVWQEFRSVDFLHLAGNIRECVSLVARMTT